MPDPRFENACLALHCATCVEQENEHCCWCGEALAVHTNGSAT